MSTEVSNLIIRLSGDANEYLRTLDTVKRYTRNLSKNLKIIYEQIGSLSLGTELLNGFIEFNKAMTESKAIMTLIGDQSDRIERQAIELGSVSNKSSTEIAKAYFYLASAGLNAEQQMAAMPRVLEFATAGLMGLERATTLASDAQSAMGLKVADTEQYMRNLTRVTDVLVRANVLANANVEQFSIALTSKAGASLKATNKSIEEGTAVLAAMADQGIKGEVAGNALSRMLLLLKKSAIDNAEAQKFWGFSVYDNTGKMRNLADIVEQLEKLTGNMSDETKAAAFEQLGFTARIQAFILPLLGTSQKIREYEKELRMAGGTTKEVSNKILMSFSSQIEIAKNNVANLGIALGTTLAGPLYLIVTVFSSIIRSVEKANSVIYNMGTVVVSSTIYLITLTTVIPIVTKAIVVLRAAIVGLWATIKANPFTFALAIIMSFVAGLSILINKINDTKGAYDAAIKSAKEWADIERTSVDDTIQASRAMLEENRDKFLSENLKEAEKILAEKEANLKEMEDSLSDYLGLKGVGQAIGEFMGLSDFKQWQYAFESLKISTNESKDSVAKLKKELDDFRNNKTPTELAVKVKARGLVEKLRQDFNDLNKSKDIQLFDELKDQTKRLGIDLTGLFSQIQDGFEKIDKHKRVKEVIQDIDKLRERFFELSKIDDVSEFIRKHSLDPNDPMDNLRLQEYKNTLKSIRMLEEEQGLKRRADEIKDRYMLPEDKLKKGTEELNKLLEKNLITIEEYDLAMNDLKKTLLGVSDAQKELNSSMSYGNSESFRFIYEYMSGFGNKNRPNFVKKNFDFGPKMKNVLAMNVDTDNQGKNAIDLLSKAVGYLEEIAGGEGTPLSLANLS